MIKQIFCNYDGAYCVVLVMVCLAQLNSKLLGCIVSHFLLQFINLLVCERPIHGPVGDAVAMALLVCLGMLELVNTFNFFHQVTCHLQKKKKNDNVKSDIASTRRKGTK